MLTGVLDAAGEEVLRLRASEECDDALDVPPPAVLDEVGQEGGGDGADRGRGAAGEVEEVEVAGRIGLRDEEGRRVGGGEDVDF